MQHCNEIQVIPILKSFVNLSLTVFSRNWPCVALKRFDTLSVLSESSQHRPARRGARPMRAAPGSPKAVLP